VDPGYYCLELAPASGVVSGSRPAIVTADGWHTTPPVSNTTAMFGGGCGTNGIGVKTFRRTSSSAADAVPADTVAFMVLVP
jgi:hypothetical protein